MDSKNYIGKTVKVKIDRPLGSKHPNWDMIYTVNYGYVPNTVSGDGEEVDCYVLGVFKPIEKFEGKCIAVIRRIKEDDHHKSCSKSGGYTDRKRRHTEKSERR